MAKAHAPELVVLTTAQLEQLLAELRGLLPTASYQLVEGLLQTLQWVMQAFEQKTLSFEKLRRMLFGHKTEKAALILEPNPQVTTAPADSVPAQPPAAATPPKRRGHGRIGAQQYTGAERIFIPHPDLQAGGRCPECAGKLHEKAPCRIVCITAQPLFPATLYEGQVLRCSLCQKVFTAPLPERATLGKYDPSVGDMLGLYRFGAGLPNYRMAKLQAELGVPFPASTQWELMDQAAQRHQPILEALIDLAAKAQLIYHDDTTMRVQSLRRQILQDQEQDRDQRTGIFTTGIIAQVGEHQVALYLTGTNHAGENLSQLLRRRPAGLEKPLQMCDALSRNHSEEFQTILCNCLSHGRRGFVDVVKAFPQECRFVIESLSQVYAHDAQAKEQKLSAADRLAFHQEHSQPVMDALQLWMNQQFEQKKVEPNSGLGEAIGYMLKHWEPLTRFLSVPGAPLDNNICERALKKAILHRKNSLSFKTLRGAQVGDSFMSLIQTCSLNHIHPLDYLKALRLHADQMRQDPLRWLPWNYTQNLSPSDTS